MSTSEEKETPSPGITLAMVTDVLELSKLQIRAVFNAVWGKVPDLANAEYLLLSDGELLALILADTLEKFAFLKAEQRMLILTSVRVLILTSVYETLIAKKEDVCCPRQLVFCDGRYCTWTGHTGFMDIETGDNVEILPEPSVETLAYNLDMLYRRGVQKIENRAGRRVKKLNAGSVDEQGNVWQRVTDVVP